MTRDLRPLTFVLCSLPLARLIVLGVQDGLGANPVEFVTRSLGTWALVLLCATLALSPLRRLSGWSGVLRLRRWLGLACFSYVLLHFLTWFWLDQWFSVPDMIRDVLRRPFIAAGMAALLLLIPLALTSSDAMVRRLGRRWAKLHRLVWPALALALAHLWWHKAGKNDFVQPLSYGAVALLLIGLRVFKPAGGAPARTATPGARARGSGDSRPHRP